MAGRDIDRSRYSKNNTVFQSLAEFLVSDSLSEGVITVVHNGLPIDFLYRPVAKSDQALFIYHGAVDIKFTLPVFQGGGVSANVNCHRIFFSDPSLTISGDKEIDGGLTLSWHAGNYRVPNLQDIHTKIIRKILELLNVKVPIFHGISGGGYASLVQGSRFDGSIVIPCNAQTDISKFYDWPIERYANIAFGIPKGTKYPVSEFPSEVTSEVRSIYANRVNCTVFYMQNDQDALHIKWHMLPFFDELLPTNEVYLLLDYWGPGHTQAPKELFSSVLEASISPDVVEEMKSLGFKKISGS
ncbi:hypothetical protein [Corynebacterium sp. H130]|uniref:hypothetical protein n=1 Tax=Corynebacterium sp. H130 TaxID=3133444 RepID=UPI00309F1EC6